MTQLVDHVRAMDMRSARTELALVFHDFESRHRQTHQIFMQRYDEIDAQLELDGRRIREEKKLLIVAYFYHEYSCGCMWVGDDIFLPYGVADSSVAFAFVAITDLLGAM